MAMEIKKSFDDFVQHVKAGVESEFRTIALPLLQQVQKKHLKRIWKIKSRRAESHYQTRAEYLSAFREAGYQHIGDIASAIEVIVVRLEKARMQYPAERRE
jgi:hypothetical protein